MWFGLDLFLFILINLFIFYVSASDTSRLIWKDLIAWPSSLYRRQFYSQRLQFCYPSLHLFISLYILSFFIALFYLSSSNVFHPFYLYLRCYIFIYFIFGLIPLPIPPSIHPFIYLVYPLYFIALFFSSYCNFFYLSFFTLVHTVFFFFFEGERGLDSSTYPVYPSSRPTSLLHFLLRDVVLPSFLYVCLCPSFYLPFVFHRSFFYHLVYFLSFFLYFRPFIASCIPAQPPPPPWCGLAWLLYFFYSSINLPYFPPVFLIIHLFFCPSLPSLRLDLHPCPTCSFVIWFWFDYSTYPSTHPFIFFLSPSTIFSSFTSVPTPRPPSRSVAKASRPSASLGRSCPERAASLRTGTWSEIFAWPSGATKQDGRGGGARLWIIPSALENICSARDRKFSSNRNSVQCQGYREGGRCHLSRCRMFESCFPLPRDWLLSPWRYLFAGPAEVKAWWIGDLCRGLAIATSVQSFLEALLQCVSLSFLRIPRFHLLSCIRKLSPFFFYFSS